MAGLKLNLHDLQFVLKQIKIAEAHSNGAALTEIRLNPATGEVITAANQYGADGLFLGDATWPRAIPDTKTPFGLRTVDGSYNNLMEGREFWGAANQPMPRLFEPNYINDADGDSFDPDGPFGPAPNLLNNNYDNPTSVADADPRIISNLVVDMSFNNPAAIVAALAFAGSEEIYGAGGDLETAQTAVTAYKAALAAIPAADPVEDKLAAGQAALADLKTAFADLSIEMRDDGSLVIPNVAPDEGLSAPFNAWMTFFGQFFDHGLDLISKGGNGTVYVPLQPDDPLLTHGPDGVPGTGDEASPFTNFMVLTRSTEVTNASGEPSQRNVTTSWVDQNQTYTSHASHQVFLREYEMGTDGKPYATGRLLEGANGGLATWADVKLQAAQKLGIVLSNSDVFAVPLLLTDAYGEFIRDANGFPQVVTAFGANGPTAWVSGTPAAPVVLSTLNGGAGPVRTKNAFLDDIAHNAVPPTGLVDHDRDPGTPSIQILPDADNVAGNLIIPNGFGINETYDDELLDRHFITGDGRGNENIGLTAVHHIFHSEHNRQVELQKHTILASGDLVFLNEWLAADVGTFPASPAEIDGLVWDGERLFQAARFATEMQYQHLVFEEFARKVQPAIDPFVFNSVTDIDPSIFAEFANVVYRFGHSMLTESMPRVFVDADGIVTSNDDMGLITSFLNPLAYDNDGGLTHEEAAGAIVRGMTVERGNEIDEFITGALRNNLLGLPLDLASINIARGRDTGMPTLNLAREQLFAATGSTFVKPYTSWVEFAANLKNPLSVVNFIAAYGTHSSIAGTLEQKRDAAWLLVFGDTGAPADRLDFLNARGTTWGNQETGLNNIDLWIGGLAEKKMPFGGMLGSTFNAVFEAQLEALQDGDRFYYLTRTQGLNFLNMLEENSFAKLIMANTDLTLPGPDGIRGTGDDIVTRHIGVDSFATYDFVYEVDATKQADYDPDDLSATGVDPLDADPVMAALGFTRVIRDDPGTAAAETNYFRTFGGEHVVVGGTSGNDTIITDFGDDGIWGGDGDDRIESGAGVDLVSAGAGNDIITDSGDTGDFLKGEEGDDVIANSNGLDVLMGGSGKDVVFVGVDDTEVFGGDGDDFIVGGDGVDFLLGNEGSDWMEAGAGFDTTAGDNSELFFNSTILGHDVMFAGSEEHDFDGESGDDIMVQGESVMRNEGMFGFDWVSYQGARFDADADMRIRIFTTEEQDILRNRFDKVEAVSGGDGNDNLRGDDRAAGEAPAIPTVNNTETLFFNDELSQAGLGRIEGLRQLLGHLVTVADGSSESIVAFTGGNILLGGAGGDRLQGNGGDDFIDGNARLNVRIRITEPGEANTAGNQIATVDSLKHVFTQAEVTAMAANIADAVLKAKVLASAGKSLFEMLLDRTIVPNQLHIVREIIADDGLSTDVDTAVFNDNYDNDDGTLNYTITPNSDGTITVAHVTVSNVDDPITGRPLISDGVDTVRNVERLEFRDQTIVFTPPQLYLQRSLGEYADDFNSTSLGNSDGTTDWLPDWAETDDAGGAGGGQIQIDNGTNELRFIDGNGGQIQRTLNLAGATSANLSYTVDENSLGGGESVTVFFSRNGADFVQVDQITSTTNEPAAPRNIDLTLFGTGAFTANAAIRFVATSIANNDQGADDVQIDNLSVTFATAPVVDYTTTFTEDGADQDIASNPLIVESDEIVSARIVLTNPQVGDSFDIPGNLPGNINSSVATVAGQLVVTLTTTGAGEPSLANWQAAIQAIEFTNSSENPSATPRIVQVTVNDGFLNSNIATTTINVVPVDDPVNAGNDEIITNVVPGTPIIVPKWVLLLNDVDPDNTLDITAVSGQTGLTATLGVSAITVTDTGPPDGDFDYTATGGPDTDLATVDVDTLANTTTFSEQFGANSYTTDDGTWVDNWTESEDTGDSNTSPTGGAALDNGQIRINGGRLEFDNGSNAANSNGASIQRAVAGLAGQTSAILTYSANPDFVEAGEFVRVFFSADGSEAGFVQLNEITGNGGNVTYTHDLTGPFTANATLRFVVSALNDTNDLVGIDDISIAYSTPVTAVNGTGGSEILIGDDNGTTFDAGTGNDTILAGGGDDTIVWNANNAAANSLTGSDGRDIVDGGDGADDTFTINGNPANNVAETYRVYSRVAADAAGLTVRNTTSEIVITRGGTDNASIIAELDNIEEIVINTDNGNDTVLIVGDFSPTSLDVNTITINGGNGDDTIDFSQLQSAHRIVFKSNGGNDTVIGNVRPQDVIELAPGQDASTYTLQDLGGGMKRFTNGTHSITFMGALPPQFQNSTGNGGPVLDDEDLEDLRGLANSIGRDSSGYGNNVDHPTWGTAGQQFIRLTDPFYTDGASAIRETALTPREISDILANQDNDGNGQEESIPNTFGGTSLLTFFGQYFDHGLDFVAKGQPGNVAIGSTAFPISAPRSNIVPGTGIDPDGVPNSGDEIAAQYINNASPYVDQNQAYGSHDEITNLLRKWVAGSTGQPAQQTAYLLTGALDETGLALLPTLTHIRENYRVMTGGDEITAADIANYNGTGQSLLIDFIPAFDAQGQLDLDAIGHYFVTGDGRANENVMLTSIHTVWARNHNFWVDNLKARTSGSWTEAEYFEAARAMNIAEYQRVVFTEFATAMAGGLDNDDEHGFEGYDPAVDASISVEFSQAAYRFGHSMLNETVSYVDANGQLQEKSLVDSFLRPDVVASGGINGLLSGSVQVKHQAIDVDMVNALRNQLVGRPLDLAALNIFRGRDMGIASFNSVRAQLFEQTALPSLRPYSGWDDFQQRNDLSSQLIDQVKLAYGGNFAAVDLWIGGLLEKPRAGQLGSTFGYIFLEQLDRLQHGDRFYYLEIFDDSLFTGENNVTFANIIERNTGLTGLPPNVFDLDASNAPADDDDSIFNPDADDDDDDTAGNDDDAPDQDDDDDPGHDDDDDDDADQGDDDDAGGGDDDDDTDDTDDDDDDDDDTGQVPTPPITTPLPHVIYLGTTENDVGTGTAGNDTLGGGKGNDTLFGFAGDDNLTGGDNDDTLVGDAGSDLLLGDAGNDTILAGAGNDRVFGGADRDTIFGDDGDDVIFGNEGDDTVDGGNGNDTFYASIGDGNDTYNGGAGSDTLDLSAIMADVNVNLLSGIVSSGQSGSDGVTGVEVVKGGAGNDTITVGFGTGVVDGGAGNDTFVFTSVDTANVTIEGFTPGDKIDLRPLFQTLQLGGGADDFTLIPSGAFTAAGQIKLETSGSDTFVRGNADGDPDNEFSIKIAGRPVSAGDFA